MQPFQSSTGATVQTLPTAQNGNEAELLRGLRDGESWAKLALYDRYARQVQRILLRVLGPDSELDDALHECFLQAYGSIGSVRDPSSLSGWMSSVAVFTARRVIRHRKARQWLRFWAPEDLPEQPALDVEPGLREAVRRTYCILNDLDTDDRVAFALRFIDGMKLSEVAEATNVSLATAKRRIRKAEMQFAERARNDELLRERFPEEEAS